MVKKYEKPVHLTFTSLYYIPEQYLEIANIILQCMSIGFQSFIIADPALLLYLRQQRIDCDIHLSGETAEVNSEMLKTFEKTEPEASDLSQKKQYRRYGIHYQQSRTDHRI